MDFDINAYLRLNPMDMIMVCVSTLIIVAVAKHFFWDKVLAYLDARKAAIQADIDAGLQSKEAGEQYKRQYEEQMANARGEAHELLESLSIILSLFLVACIPQAMAQKQSRLEKLLKYLNDNDADKWQKNRDKIDDETQT